MHYTSNISERYYTLFKNEWDKNAILQKKFPFPIVFTILETTPLIIFFTKLQNIKKMLKSLTTA